MVPYADLCFLSEKSENLDTTSYEFLENYDEEISCQEGWTCLSVFHDDVYFTMVLDIPDRLHDELYCQGSQILLNNLNSDMKIVCLDGEIITCHKNIMFGLYKNHINSNKF